MKFPTSREIFYPTKTRFKVVLKGKEKKDLKGLSVFYPRIWAPNVHERGFDLNNKENPKWFQ